MRITQNSMNRTQMSGLNASLGRLQKTQEQLTTGKRLNRASDDPVGAVTAMRLRDQQRTLTALGNNIDDGLSRLRVADDALGRTSDMLNRVRSLVVAGANGVNGSSQLDSYAQEVEQLRQGMVQLANTKYAGQAVFGGTATGDAYDPASGAYQGNSQPVLRKVSDADGAAGDINVTVPGATAFSAPAGSGSANLLEKATDASGNALTRLNGQPAEDGLLARIADHLKNGPASALQQDLADLDKAADNLSSAQATVGARTNRLTQMQDVNGRADDDATVALSKVEDTDFMKAAMDLSVQSNAYQAALNASAKIIQPSLMDFIK